MIHLILSGRTSPEFHTTQIPFNPAHSHENWTWLWLSPQMFLMPGNNVRQHTVSPVLEEIKKCLKGHQSSKTAVCCTASSQTPDSWKNLCFYAFSELETAVKPLIWSQKKKKISLITVKLKKRLLKYVLVESNQRESQQVGTRKKRRSRTNCCVAQWLGFQVFFFFCLTANWCMPRFNNSQL